MNECLFAKTPSRLFSDETPRIQERMKIETTAEVPLFTVEIQSSVLAEKTSVYLLISGMNCKLFQ